MKMSVTKCFELSCRVYLWAADSFRSHSPAIMFLLGAFLLAHGLGEFAAAQTGGEIFKSAAVNLACNVLPGRFGAMLSAFAGIFALVAAATGAYRAVWALVFVSVGCYIAGEFVGILFGDTVKC